MRGLDRLGAAVGDLERDAAFPAGSPGGVGGDFQGGTVQGGFEALGQGAVQLEPELLLVPGVHVLGQVAQVQGGGFGLGHLQVAPLNVGWWLAFGSGMTLVMMLRVDLRPCGSSGPAPSVTSNVTEPGPT